MLVVLAACGCSAIDSSISQRIYTINKSIEEARNESVLLNIVRASYSHPLNFVTVSKIGGGGALDFRSQLPTLTLGPNRTDSQRQVIFQNNTVDASVSGNFDVAVLDSRDFFKGLLTPVDVPEINLFIHQGFPRELLFYTLVESIRVTYGRSAYEYRNDPSDDRWSGIEGDDYCNTLSMRRPGSGLSGFDPPFASAPWTPIHKHDCNFQKFRYFIRLALRYGLTTEVYSDEPLRKLPDQKKSNKPAGRFCFDSAIAHEKAIQNILFPTSRCREGANNRGARALQFQFPRNVRLGFEVKTRSAFGIYRYLGQLLRSGTMETLVLKDSDGAVSGPYGEQKLLSIVRGSNSGCFTMVSYWGEYFCVPIRHSEYTKLTFSVLTQLSALNTTAADLPVTSTVRITP